MNRDNLEIRLNKDGSVDEILVYDLHDGRLLFHLEQMDNHYYWMKGYGITQDLIVHIGATMGKRRGEPIPGEEVQPGKVYDGTMFRDGKTYEMIETDVDGPVVFSDWQWDDASTESQCHEDYLTPEQERLGEIKNIINKYGIISVLNDIASIYKLGRNADFEKQLIENLEQTAKSFDIGDKAYWKAEMENATIQDMVPGDFVKYQDKLLEIKSIWGVSPEGWLAKPSEGGFGVVTTDGQTITMWQAQAYYKRESTRNCRLT